MAKLVYGLMSSLDGYVADERGEITLPVPEEPLHRWFNHRMQRVTGSIYGRRMYEVMSYWDGDLDPAAEVEREFAEHYQATPKWVVSSTLSAVGPNATLLRGDLETEVRRLKDSHDGEIEVAGPELAAGLTELGLIDEYWLFLMPVVLGGGKPAFTAAMPDGLELAGMEELPQQVALVKYRRPS